MSKCKLDLHKTFYMNWIGRTITCNNRFWPSPDFNTPWFQCFVELFSLARRNSAVIFSQHDECGCFDLRRNSKIVTKQMRNRHPQALVTSNSSSSNNTSNIPQKHKNNTKNNQTKNDVQTTRNTNNRYKTKQWHNYQQNELLPVQQQENSEKWLLSFPVSTADQRQTSPFNLWPTMCGTVWRNWLVGIKVGETINSPNVIHTICLRQLGRIRIKIFGVSRVMPHSHCKHVKNWMHQGMYTGSQQAG